MPVPIERLNAEEQVMLGASAAFPQDIGALAILDGRTLFDDDGRFRLESVRAVVASRLHLVPRFRMVLRDAPRGRGAPYWTDAPGFDLARHVGELRLEAPAGEAALLAAVEMLRAERFDRARPLWAMWLLTGLPDQRVALFVKIHHTVADGLAAMTIMASLLDFAPGGEVPAQRPWFPRRAPRQSQLVADTIRRRLHGVRHGFALLGHPARLIRGAREMWPAVHELLADEPGDSTSIDRIVGEGRRLALVRSGHRAVRRIGRTFGASVNDVLLAATAGGMRRLLASRGEPVEGVTLKVYVPVSLRRHLRGPQQGVDIAQMAVPLSLTSMDPVERLRQIAAETHRRKARPRPSLGALFRGRFVTMLLLRAVMAQRVNITTASIPGPPRTGYLAGAPVLEIFPVIPLLGNEVLGVGAITYADTFTIGITADADAVADLDVLAAGIRDELAELTRAVELATRDGRGDRRRRVADVPVPAASRLADPQRRQREEPADHHRAAVGGAPAAHRVDDEQLQVDEVRLEQGAGKAAQVEQQERATVRGAEPRNGRGQRDR
jgi:diacylglycerol O-acyltransferase